MDKSEDKEGKEPKKENSIEKESEEKIEKLGQEIKEMVDIVTETNKKIDDDFYEKVKRLEDKKKLVPEEKENEKHQTRMETLKEKLGELKASISEARKSGKDPFIASLMLKNVNAKLKMADVTHEEKDYRAVENILNNARLELNEALKQEEVDVKKEIEARLRHDVAKETGKVIVE